MLRALKNTRSHSGVFSIRNCILAAYQAKYDTVPPVTAHVSYFVFHTVERLMSNSEIVKLICCPSLIFPIVLVVDARILRSSSRKLMLITRSSISVCAVTEYLAPKLLKSNSLSTSISLGRAALVNRDTAPSELASFVIAFSVCRYCTSFTMPKIAAAIRMITIATTIHPCELEVYCFVPA